MVARQLAPLLALLSVLLLVSVPLFPRGYRAWRVANANKQLLAAAAANDLRSASMAIAAGANVNVRDAHERSAIYYASRSANIPLIEMLVGAGADYDATTVLTMAVREDALALARRVLEAGANPNRKGNGGITFLHFCAERGAIDMLELLLEFGADLEQSASLTPPNITVNGPPLLAAAGCSKPDGIRLHMIRVLLEHGADPNADLGRTAMDIAVRDSDGALGDLLREHGAAYGPREAVAFNRLNEVALTVRENPAILGARHRPVYAARPGRDPTLLGMALSKGYHDLALYLIEQGAPLDTIEYHGSTLLHLAARGGDPQLVQLLVTRGPDVNARDEYQDTPLTESAWEAPLEVISTLINAGADVNARGMNGQTAFYNAVSRDRVEAVRLLLAAGANPTIPNIRGETAIDIARSRNFKAMELFERTVLHED